MTSTNTPEVSRDFKGIWIPREIWFDDRLDYFERCLFVELNSLDGKDGCFASNEYLCKFFRERERKIQTGLSKLKSLGYVTQISFDGRTRILKTHPETIYVKFNTSGVSNPTPLPCQNQHPPLYIENKEEKKETTTGRHAAPAAVFEEDYPDIEPTPPKKSPPAIVHTMYESLIRLDIPDHDKWQIQKNFTEDVVDKAVEYATHPSTQIKTTLVQTVKWACKNLPQIAETEQGNKKIAQEILPKCKKTNNIRIEILNKEVEFSFPTAQKEAFCLKYSEKGFKEQLENILRKLDLYGNGDSPGIAH